MRYSTVSNPIYADAGHTGIVCMVEFEGFDTPIPFLAMASDPMPHGQDIFNRLLAGEFGPIANYVPHSEA